MGYLDEFSKLKEDHRVQIVCIAILMPFFYLSIFINHTNFFNESPIQIPILLAFAYSMITYFMSVIIAAFIYVEYIEDHSKKSTVKKPEEEKNNILSYGVVVAVLVVFTTGMLEYIQSYGLMWYTLMLAITLIIVLGIVLLSIAIRGKIEDRNKKKINS